MVVRERTTRDEVMARLEAAGTERQRAIYRRHGALAHRAAQAARRAPTR